jgi:tetratricopeptide (TPR) repeat protein
LWASWCQPCLSELQQLKQQADALAQAGLIIVALSTDRLTFGPSSDPQSALDFAEEAKLPFPIGFANEPLVQQLQLAHDKIFYRRRALPLPCSFLVDEQGKLAVLYKGPIGAAQLLEDIGLLNATQAKLDLAASPFQGTPILKLFAPNPLGFAEAYREGGYLDEARNEVTRYLKNLTEDADATSLPEVIQRSLNVEKRNRGTSGSVANSDSQAADRPDIARATRIWKARQRRLTIQAYRMLAQIEHEANRPEAEIAALREVVKIEPASAVARSELALALWARGGREEAESQLSEILAGPAPEAAKLTIVGQTRMKSGQIDTAARALRQAIELDPDHLEARFSLAIILQLQGHASDAIAEYRSIIEKHPQALDAINNLAWLFATHSNPQFRNADEAVSLARRICESTNHENPSYLDTLAAALAEAGDFAGAAETAAKGQRIARRQANLELAEKLGRRAEIYRAGRPFRE